MKLCVFDLNDTLITSNRADGFVTQPWECQWVDGALDTLRSLVASGWVIVVATNQSAHLHREFCVSLADMEEVILGIQSELEHELDTQVDFEVCWHGPGAGCPCRKPAPGLVMDAIAWAGEKPEMLVMVGDKKSDMDAGEAAGADMLVMVGAGANLVHSGTVPVRCELESVAFLKDVLADLQVAQRGERSGRGGR